MNILTKMAAALVCCSLALSAHSAPERNIPAKIKQLEQRLNYKKSANEKSLNDSSSKKEYADITPYIVGGGPTAPGSWPYIVALVQNGYDPYYGQFCGGSLIREDVVLTASHCVDGASPSDINVYVGSQILSEPGEDGELISVDKIIMHEFYDPNLIDNDIALIFLSKPTSLPVVPTLSAQDMDLIFPGEPMTVAGWGNMNPDGADFPDQLQEVTVEYIDQQVCSDAYDAVFGEGSVTENMLCAGTYSGGQDSCHGDSGGPLVVTLDGEVYQAGIVSWGLGTCAATGYYGVYTRVSQYENWIDRNINRYIEDFPVWDENLQNCIEQTAALNGWVSVDEVTALDCSNMGIYDLDGLSDYKNLSDLNLAQNQLYSTWALTGLKNLVTVDLSYNSDLYEISGLLASSGLQSVSLFGDYGITCLDVDQGPFTYQQLSVCYELISDLEFDDENLANCVAQNAGDNGIYEVPDLYLLDCPNQGISSLQGIEQLYGLNYVYLDENIIKDFSLLASLPNLLTLSAAENPTMDSATLASITQLEDLYIPLNNLTNLDFVENMWNLRNAYFHFNDISDISGLTGKSSLVNLVLWDNQISDISPLESNTNITYLDLDTNNIEDITALQDMTQMDGMYLTSNLISDISSLENMTVLYFLNASYNDISDISPLVNAEDLQELYLYGNDGITCLDPNDSPFAYADIPEACFIPPWTDSDNDGIPDNEDNCPNKPNWNQKDTDGDGMGNRCDPDDDNDGFTDAEENRVGSNPRDPNSTPESILYDADSDGILNEVDNCPNKKNPNQKDYDLDGLGNACDDDDDNDGFSDALENNVGSDPLNPISTPETIAWDADGDGIDDSWDNCLGVSNPNQKDTDHDGMGNKCDDDDDNDGFTDEEEKAAGTNPRNPDSHP